MTDPLTHALALVDSLPWDSADEATAIKREQLRAAIRAMGDGHPRPVPPPRPHPLPGSEGEGMTDMLSRWRARCAKLMHDDVALTWLREEVDRG